MCTALAAISNQLSQIGCYSGMLSPSALVCHFLLLEYVTPSPLTMGMFSTRLSSNTDPTDVGSRLVGRPSGRGRPAPGETLWSSKMSRQHFLLHHNFGPYTTINPFISWHPFKPWWWLRYSGSRSASIRSNIGTWASGRGAHGGVVVKKHEFERYLPLWLMTATEGALWQECRGYISLGGVNLE